MVQVGEEQAMSERDVHFGLFSSGSLIEKSKTSGEGNEWTKTNKELICNNWKKTEGEINLQMMKVADLRMVLTAKYTNQKNKFGWKHGPADKNTSKKYKGCSWVFE